MTLIDYNGEGRWTRENILARYAQYAAKMKIELRDLSPRESSDNTGRHWVYPVMDEIIKGINAGDLACIQIGIEFIEEDARFPFGKTLKSNTARALRRATLTGEQQYRIRKRVFAMLRAGHVPHEYGEYAKLVRSIGFEAADFKAIEPASPYAAKFLRYFEQAFQDDGKLSSDKPA